MIQLHFEDALSCAAKPPGATIAVWLEEIIFRQEIVPYFACKRGLTNHQQLPPTFNDFHQGSTTYTLLANLLGRTVRV